MMGSQRATSVLRLTRRGVRLAGALATGQSLPFAMTFILTHRCNFRCEYCDIPDAAGAEMTTADFCRALDELTAAGLARASFSGGEALLRPDALDIIAHARGLGLSTSLNSNGWLTASQMGQLPASLDLLMVSLDGPRPVHDRLRRKSGSFRRALEVLDIAKSSGIITTTITVLTPDNLDVIEPMLALAADHGFWAYFQPKYLDCFTHTRGLDPALDGRVLADVAFRLAAARKAGLPVGASPGFLTRLARGPRFGDCTTCNAGRYFGTVMPDGVIVPCHLTFGDRAWPNGLELGFARAFMQLPRPLAGPGCAISPYQESDLIFGLDPSAVITAMRRLTTGPAERSRDA